MNIDGNTAVYSNPFDQDLNTYDNVDFTRVDVSGAIIDNSQLATKLYVDTHGGGGGGNMTYTGITPATNNIYKALASNGHDATTSNITDNGTVVTITADCVANKFVKSGGTAIQYLMGDGSTLTQSATSGNSNFYLYKSIDGVTTPPPSSGNIGYNNAVQASATIVYISHLTRDSIDIEVFYNQVNQLNDLYIQDQNSSINFIKYNITGTPTPTPNSYLEIPVVMESYGGTGNTSFGANHNVLLAFFSNLTEVDQRLSTLETKTYNQSATAGTTNISGTLTANTLSKVGGLPTQFLKADGTVDANTYLYATGSEFNVGTSQAPLDIFNNGSSLTKNNFNTSQSIGCIGFKDNWNTATGNNSSIKQGMIYMSNVGRVIITSNSAPQYFDDTTGTLINITNGLSVAGSFLFIPSLGLAYSRNSTQYSTSVDGITWTTPANILGYITGAGIIVYSPNLNLYVAATGIVGSLIQTSTDGITWTIRTATRGINNIIYTGTRFISFGSAGCMYSTDGITWVNDTVQLNNIRASIYCDTLGCILAQIQGGNRNIIRSYDSGLTWTTLTNVFPFDTASNRFIWDNVSGKAYNMADEPNNSYIYNSYLWEFDASGNPALGGNIQMMGNTSSATSSGLTNYIYNQSLKRFLFTRNAAPHPVFYSTTSNNLAVSGNQYIIGSLNLSGSYNPYGLANIDIMLRDTPFIGIQYIQGSGLYSTLSNSPYSSLGSTSSVASTFALTNNITRQLCCADWSFPSAANGQICGYGSTLTTGARVSTGYNFGLSAIFGYNDTNYAAGCQNFFGLYNNYIPPALNATTPLTAQLSYICFGSSTADDNICIYTAGAGAGSAVKQVDLGVDFPSNRTAGAISTDWFKLTLYWDETKFYYKAVNTLMNTTVSGSFTPLAINMPISSIQLYPLCFRAMGSSNPSSSCRLKVQRFGVYYN